MFGFKSELSDACIHKIARATVALIMPAIRTLNLYGRYEMASLADITAATQILTDEVAALTTVTQSVETLLNGVVAQNKVLSDELAAAIAANDPVAIQAASDALAAANVALAANISGLTAAVTANTPAPVVEPIVVPVEPVVEPDQPVEPVS